MPKKWLIPPGETVHGVIRARLCVSDDSMRPTGGDLWITDQRIAWAIHARGGLIPLLTGDDPYLASETRWVEFCRLRAWHLDGKTRLLIIESAVARPQRFLQPAYAYPQLTLALKAAGLCEADDRDCSWVLRDARAGGRLATPN